MLAIYENINDNTLEYTLVIPGVNKDDVLVEVSSNDELSIAVLENDYCDEINVSTFIPYNTSADSIEVSLINGILKVVIPNPTTTILEIKG